MHVQRLELPGIEPDGTVILTSDDALAQEETVVLPDDGQATLQHVHADDVAQAFANGADYIVVGRPIRQAADPLARDLEIAPSTVDRALARLGRHCLLFHERHRPQGPLSEPLVLDGFISVTPMRADLTAHDELAGLATMLA